MVKSLNKFFSVKILVCLMLLVICIILCCNFTVAERIQTDINDWVLDYAEIFENSKQNCEIKNIIPIYDLNNNIVRVCFEYYCNESPYFYIVFDNNKKTGISPIVEFGYGDKLFDETKKNVCLSNMEYGTVANNIVTCKSANMSLSSAKSKYTVEQNTLSNTSNISLDNDGFLTDLVDFKDVEAMYFSGSFLNFTPLTQSDLATSSQIGNGICGATTAMNVLKYYDEVEYFDVFLETNGSRDIIATYNKLRTYQTPIAYNIESQTKRNIALRQYIDKNTNLNFYSVIYAFNSWDFVCNDLSSGKLIDYRYDTSNDSGHCVLAVAAFELNSSLYSNARFLAVADTWNDFLRCINYGYHTGYWCMSVKIYD